MFLFSPTPTHIFYFSVHNQFQSLYTLTHRVNQIDISPGIKECGKKERERSKHQIHHHTVGKADSVFWRITNGRRLDKRKLRNHFPKVIIHLCDKFLQSNTRATKRWRRWRRQQQTTTSTTAATTHGSVVLASFIVEQTAKRETEMDVAKHGQSKARRSKKMTHSHTNHSS